MHRRPAEIRSSLSKSSRMLRRTGVPSKPASRCGCPSRCTISSTVALLALPAESRTSCWRQPRTRTRRSPITEAAPVSHARLGLEPALDGARRRDRRRANPLHTSAARRRRLRGSVRLRRIEVHRALPSCSRIPKHGHGSSPLRWTAPTRGRGGAGEARRPCARQAVRYARCAAPRPRLRAHAEGSQDKRFGRAVEAAFLHFEAGDSRRAEAQLRTVIDGLMPVRAARARALNLLARIRPYEAPSEAPELFEQVLDEADGDREILALAHEGLARLHSGSASDSMRPSPRGHRLRSCDRIGDDALAADALCHG